MPLRPRHNRLLGRHGLSTVSMQPRARPEMQSRLFSNTLRERNVTMPRLRRLPTLCRAKRLRALIFQLDVLRCAPSRVVDRHECRPFSPPAWRAKKILPLLAVVSCRKCRYVYMYCSSCRLALQRCAVQARHRSRPRPRECTSIASQTSNWQRRDPCSSVGRCLQSSAASSARSGYDAAVHQAVNLPCTSVHLQTQSRAAACPMASRWRH